MVSHPMAFGGMEAQIGHGSAALITGQTGLIATSPLTMDSTQATQAGAHDPAGSSPRGPTAVYIGSPAKRPGSPTKRPQKGLRPPSAKAERPSPPRPGVTHRRPRSRSPSQRACDPNDDDDRGRQHYDVAHLAALVEHLSTAVASLDARVQSFEGKARDLENDLRGQIGEANRNSKGLTAELEQKMEGVVPSLVGNLETMLAARIDKVEGFVQSLYQAKPGEEQTLMGLFSRLDAEVKRLDQEPKAQTILDEAKKVIYEAVSENKRECLGQLHDLGALTQQKFDGLAHDLSALGSELKMTQTMFGGTGPPGVPPHAASDRKTRFVNWGAGCGDDGCNDDHSGADRQGRGRGGATGKGFAQTQSAGAPWPSGCHCPRVDKLIDEMRAVQGDVGRLQSLRSPLIPGGAPDGGRAPNPYEAPTQEAPRGYGAPEGSEPGGQKPGLPLSLGPLGALTTNRIFDDRVSTQEEFRFKGLKGGYAWKSKVENYLISRVPAINEILYWAEREESGITSERLHQAVGRGLEICDRDGNMVNHVEVLNSSVWGFLANCVSGEAEVMFKQAPRLAGIDAWRRIIRLIDNGRGIRLEQLRNEMRQIRAYPIKSLEGVTVGVAEYENRVRDYVEAGGRQPPEDEMKSDLNAILPNELGDHLSVRVTDHNLSYQAFRDFVVYTCAQLLMRKRRLPIQHVDEDDAEQEGSGGQEEYEPDLNTHEGLLAALRRMTGGKGTGKKKRKGTGKGQRLQAVDAGSGSQRKCTNCGGEHNISDCKKPIVDRANRPCWVCNKSGHVGAQCPLKQPTAALKAVNEESGGRPRSIWAVGDEEHIVDRHGYVVVTKGARPRATNVTMGMHLANAFTPLSRMADDDGGLPRATGVRGALAVRAEEAIPAETPKAGHRRDLRTARSAQRSHTSSAKAYFPSLQREVQKELDEVTSLMILEEEADEINAVRETTTVRVAMDSGAVKSVIHPKALPSGVVITPNDSGKHFSGAGGEIIEKYGECVTNMTTKTGNDIGCGWNAADVARPLHAVSQVTGPADHATGKHDVLFNNKRCVVVEAGVVERLLLSIKPIAEYTREGNLYLADMILSPFGRPGLKA